jgi:hypothetical protein
MNNVDKKRVDAAVDKASEEVIDTTRGSNERDCQGG